MFTPTKHVVLLGRSNFFLHVILGVSSFRGSYGLRAVFRTSSKDWLSARWVPSSHVALSIMERLGDVGYRRSTKEYVLYASYNRMQRKQAYLSH
jgi:hypothetical protein